MNKRVVILESISVPLYWVILAASVWVLLRGHNEPGGGFIGGLVAVSASILWAFARNSDAATCRLPLQSPLRLAAVGIALASASGIPAFWLGAPYLTHIWGVLPLGFTEVAVSTVMIFDLGVYLTVWGALAGYALALLSFGESDDGGHATEGGDA
ncbi:MAG: Na(+)/H(+) antiporter subunit B [Hydrogenophaga sp.]|jgi:multicomponent Na+:H+ antiporter subunit B|uniref:MnhB domain-containing protein n=1 Tax=Hydrogenophaga sp. TaxID=1904254 RepID=UPI001BC3E2FE|nr:MnhB domain-containing protein [Hydrogenophaga sp.]MBS3912564.1 Na(+)/H(+) antiporter subunit B [Hydrogenophaga sp.]MDO9149132.1 MnhB domain-containing protein [Hydrogenophaga sp.]MDO9604493.1 MnhB domain-containing protein [Hydrogenophaga sp.]MDP2163714.1 MnhB domain-containing protein [Hydrogenophaga sp.]MDP3475940.1 MnhB domain-containing protein [Hydrogenophaga sp.]